MFGFAVDEDIFRKRVDILDYRFFQHLDKVFNWVNFVLERRQREALDLLRLLVNFDDDEERPSNFCISIGIEICWFHTFIIEGYRWILNQKRRILLPTAYPCLSNHIRFTSSAYL
jgi:hypothetical protein